ncbi:MAG: response regulator [Thermoguttaceae bacterium]|nr:response regulator [Thermoguttaceae bacterium]MBR6481073.1 response regulator [Thermoguttaceae bacterium]
MSESPEDKNTTILIVDDDPEISESMRLTLEANGYRVLAARDGNAGLVLAERENPDLIVLDMMMPKRSGFLVIEALRQTESFTTRIVMITANDGSRHKDYALKLGVDAYIRKPFPMDLLLTTIRQVLDGTYVQEKDEPKDTAE